MKANFLKASKISELLSSIEDKLSSEPVDKSSIPMTECPTDNIRSVRCDPRNPAAPEINTRTNPPFLCLK